MHISRISPLANMRWLATGEQAPRWLRWRMRTGFFAPRAKNSSMPGWCLSSKKKGHHKGVLLLEAPPRIELGNNGFADRCLTAWLWCRMKFCWVGPPRSCPFGQYTRLIPSHPCLCLVRRVCELGIMVLQTAALPTGLRVVWNFAEASEISS